MAKLEPATSNRALIAGNVELVFEKTLLGRRPAEVGWPGGRWSLPGNPGVVALFFGTRREKVRLNHIG